MTTSHILQEEGELFEELLKNQKIFFVKEWKPLEMVPFPYTDLKNYPRELVNNFLHASNLRVAKSVLDRIRDEIGDLYTYNLGLDFAAGVLIGTAQEKARLRLACDTIERELEGEDKRMK